MAETVSVRNFRGETVIITVKPLKGKTILVAADEPLLAIGIYYLGYRLERPGPSMR